MKTMITSMQKVNNLLKVSDYIFFHRIQNSENGKNVYKAGLFSIVVI